MQTITGITVSELIKLTGKKRHAVEAWLSRNKIKPIIPEFFYPADTLEKLKEAKVGRPKKAGSEQHKKKPKPENTE